MSPKVGSSITFFGKRWGCALNNHSYCDIMAISNGLTNGHASTSASSSSDEVAYYLTQTTNIIQAWIKKGEDEEEPVSRFISSKEMRNEVRLSLSNEPCSNEDILKSMAMLLENSVNPWTGKFVDKVSQKR